jgi:sulfate transport system substrate-binding protein
LRRSLAVLAALISAATVGVAGSSAATHAKKDATLSLVGYSIPGIAYSKLIPAFESSAAGKGIKFTTSFAASEVQSKAVVAGLPADVVNFSLRPDVDRLVQAGYVAKSWNANLYHGFVTRSVVVFIVRNGNPKHIRSWDDLVKPGAYGAQLREGKTPKQAVAYLQKLFRATVSQDTSARNALQTFLSGRGDVLIDYESDAILAQSQSKGVFYVIPKATIQIETPLAVVSKSKNRAAAQAFVRWLYTPAAQTIWAQNGFRPVVPSVARRFEAKFPLRPQLFKIGYVGGWTKVTKQFFDPSNGVVAKIEQGLGVSTGG